MKYCRAWGSLMRLPNLLSACGDAIAGLIFAAAITHTSFSNIGYVILFAIGIPSICFYAAGMIHNDLCDVKEDLLQRPERPLPSGAISVPAAKLGMCLLFATGLSLVYVFSWHLNSQMRPVFTALGLIVCIFLYNGVLKQYSFIGSVSMGTCRALNLLLGVSYIMPFSIEHYIIAFCLLIYIVSITAMAKEEERLSRVHFKKFIPVLATSLWLIVVLYAPCYLKSSYDLYWSYSFACLFVVLLTSIHLACKLNGTSRRKDVMQAVSILIRNIILLQAAICFYFPDGIFPAVMLISFWVIHYLLSKIFSPT